MATIQGIYVAIFGRPADPAGLAYWNTETNNGADLSKMISTLSATDEFKALYDGKTDTEIITAVYQSLFGRAPDAAGLAYYLKGLTDGTLNITNIAVSIVDGAQGDDKAIVDNKVAAADAFTTSLDTQAEIDAYVGTDAANAGRDFLKPVTSDKATIPTQEATDAAILTVGSPDGGQAPATGGGGGGGGGGDPQPTSVTVDSTFTQTFDQAVETPKGPSKTEVVWYEDRAAPAGFEVMEDGERTVLKQTIDESDRNDSNGFHNTQGRKVDVPANTKVVSIELYIPEAWNNTNEVRNAGFWGTTFDDAGEIAGYPIIEFYNGGFRFWDSTDPGVWSADPALPTGFKFDAWHTLKMEVLDDGTFQYTIGDLVHRFDSPSASEAFGNVILQGYNFNFDTEESDPAETYDILWDSLTTGPTVYIDSDLDVSTFDIVNFASSNVVVATDGTLKVQASQVDGIDVTGAGLLHIVGASNVDRSADSIAMKIEGTSGGDVILTGAGDDVIFGMGGADKANGGSGSDIFVFSRSATDVQLVLQTDGGYEYFFGDESVVLENIELVSFTEVTGVSDPVSIEGLFVA